MNEYKVNGHEASWLPEGNWEMVWNDEFDGTELDRSKWDYRMSMMQKSWQAWTDKGVQCDLAMIGSKGVSFFNSVGGNVVAQVTGMGDNPSLSELIGPVKVMLQAYDEGRLDKLYIVSNKFINTMSQVPTISQLLPLPASDDDDLKHKSWDYLYEPDPKALLDTLLRRYVESQVYQGVVENLASEQAARMVAMKAATDNGGSLIKELQLVYNKARQASITQELTEIVSGAAAV